mgnify:CR=1 FL=1
MRVVEEKNYPETRDALGQNWHKLMSTALPDSNWLPIPNNGAFAVDYFQKCELDGLILSGGNDLGESSVRDQTERSLLQHAIKRNIPVLGVCRGMQLVCDFFNVQLFECEPREHIATHHPIKFSENVPLVSLSAVVLTVNSFHRFGIKADSLPKKLSILATTSDGWVEAIMVNDYPILCLMWHPEREDPICEIDTRLIQKTFGWSQ